MALVFNPPNTRATTANNALINGAKWYFYGTGTEILQTIYEDKDLNTPAANPVVSNIDGSFPVRFLDPSLVYRAVLKTSGGATISPYDFDPYNQIISTGELSFIQEGSGAASRTALSKLQETVSVLDFIDDAVVSHASIADGTNTTSLTAYINAAIAAARNILFPDGTYLSAAPTFSSNTRLYGSRSARLKFDQVVPGDFLATGTRTNVVIEGMTLDGNYTSGTTTTGWTVIFGTGANAFEPVQNACKVLNCRVLGNGFGAVALNNAGGCVVDKCDVTATTDTCIAVLNGSWDFRITSNRVSGASFGIGASSQGNQHIATMGFVRNGVVQGNTSLATKAGSYAYEWDGIQGVQVANNVAMVNGGFLGHRLFAVMPAPTYGDVDVKILNCIFSNNTVQMVQDIASAGVEIFAFAAADMTTNVLDGFTVWAKTQMSASVIGFICDGGVSGRVSRLNCSLCGINAQYQQTNISGRVFVFDRITTRGGTYGLYLDSADANKAEITVIDGDFTGASTFNSVASTGTNITRVRTPLVASTYDVPNLVRGDLPVVTATQDWANLASGASQSGDFAVANAALGAVCSASMSVDLAGTTLSACVKVAGTVTVTQSNLTGSAQNLGSGMLSIAVKNP